MINDLDEAIKHCLEVAEKHTKYNFYGGYESCDECAKKHRQLASWLKALKEIWDSGSCNDCKFSGHCEIQPKVGQLVRFNCYHFSKREVNADKGVLEKINEKQDSLKATCKAWDEAIDRNGYVN